MSPTQVQGTKALGHPQLLSQATSMELGWKWGSQDINHHPCWEFAHAGHVLEPLGFCTWLGSENFTKVVFQLFNAYEELVYAQHSGIQIQGG